MEIGVGQRQAVFRFPPDFPGFAGHFPGNSVLPGIIQILAVVHTAGGDSIDKVKNCKFLRPVHPDEALAVQVQLSAGQGKIMAQGDLRVNGEVCAAMTLHLKPSED